jgi:hypothetical protein
MCVVTLIDTVRTTIKQSTDRTLTQQLCSCLHAQLYKRWRKFCEGRPDAEQIMDPETRRQTLGIPLPVAREFILANIDWAKGRVLARLTRLMWARNSLLTDTPSSSVQGEVGDDDDEYDETAEY